MDNPITFDRFNRMDVRLIFFFFFWKIEHYFEQFILIKLRTILSLLLEKF